MLRPIPPKTIPPRAILPKTIPPKTSALCSRLPRLAVALLGLASVLATVPAAAQDWALKRLDASPRHHEWLAIKAGERTIHTFVAYPKSTGKVTAVVLIHENRGLTDWTRGLADQLAEAGYLAVAPDLLSGTAPQGGRTKDFANEDAAREAIYALSPDGVTAALDAVVDHVGKLPVSNGKVSVAGFCWGGGQALRYATHRSDLAAAFVFYGTYEHGKEDLARIKAPVYGFYAGEDARIGASVPGTATAMRELGKSFDPVTYEGATHGFMRHGEDPKGGEADRKARATAWKRWLELLARL